nr:hypothetical protein B0A51_07730 [Rachicladosporium sp. CCFEE 5018]
MYIPRSTTEGLSSAITHALQELSMASPSGGLTKEGRSSLIGIVIAMVGNVLISLALNTQRYAHMRLSKERDQAESKRKSEESTESGETVPLLAKHDRDDKEQTDDADKNKSYLRSPIWWIGITLMTVGEAGNFIAYGFAPASVVSPLGVVALVSNCLIAPLLLHERFRLRDGAGVLIAIGGCVTVVLSASGSDPRLDPKTLFALISTWEFTAYLITTHAMIIGLSILSNRYGDRTILIDVGLVALFGGYTALATKGVASLISNIGWAVFTTPITYVLTFAVVATAVMQIKYINRALQRFPATVVIPTQFVLFTISVIVGSSILYRDFERRDTSDAGKFIGGCLLTFIGVWAITSGRSSPDADAEAQDTEHGSPPEVRERSTNPALLITPSQLESPIAPHLTPATLSAIHPRSATDGTPSMPQLHATTSAPSIPQLRPSTPHKTSSPAVPQTPERGTLARNRSSIAGLIPEIGALTSPLSGSLSAVVADELRRNGSMRRRSSLRPRSGLISGDVEEAEEGEPLGRERSLSTSVRGVFRRGESGRG